MNPLPGDSELTFPFLPLFSETISSSSLRNVQQLSQYLPLFYDESLHSALYSFKTPSSPTQIGHFSVLAKQTFPIPSQSLSLLCYLVYIKIYLCLSDCHFPRVNAVFLHKFSCSTDYITQIMSNYLSVQSHAIFTVQHCTIYI